MKRWNISQMLETGKKLFAKIHRQKYHAHHKLIQNIKKHYNDPKAQMMLENIITNPIDTPRGYKNPGYGVALRGPLSRVPQAHKPS